MQKIFKWVILLVSSNEYFNKRSRHSGLTCRTQEQAVALREGKKTPHPAQVSYEAESQMRMGQANRCYPHTSQDKLKDVKCEKNCSPPMGFISDSRMLAHRTLCGPPMGVSLNDTGTGRGIL